jgi:transcriptional antiterminator
MYNPLNTQTQIAHVIQKLQKLLPEQVNEVEDFVDFLKQRKAKKITPEQKSDSFEFPADHVGKWPDNLSLSRQDLYDNDGR